MDSLAHLILSAVSNPGGATQVRTEVARAPTKISS
jgi:hypothetical protein